MTAFPYKPNHTTIKCRYCGIVTYFAYVWRPSPKADKDTGIQGVDMAYQCTSCCQFYEHEEVLADTPILHTPTATSPPAIR